MSPQQHHREKNMTIFSFIPLSHCITGSWMYKRGSSLFLENILPVCIFNSESLQQHKIFCSNVIFKKSRSKAFFLNKLHETGEQVSGQSEQILARVADSNSGGQKLPTKVEKNSEISCFEVLDVLFES